MITLEEHKNTRLLNPQLLTLSPPTPQLFTHPPPLTPFPLQKDVAISTLHVLPSLSLLQPSPAGYRKCNIFHFANPRSSSFTPNYMVGIAPGLPSWPAPAPGTAPASTNTSLQLTNIRTIFFFYSFLFDYYS